MRGAVDTYFDDVLVMAEERDRAAKSAAAVGRYRRERAWRTSSRHRVETVGGREK